MQSGLSPTEAAQHDVELRSVTKRYGRAVAVDAIDLRVGRGEFFSLLGPSGCGKTTTLRLIAGFEMPDSGQVLIGGRDVATSPPYRRDVNTVFQHYALFPHMTVAENVAFGLEQRKTPREQIGRRVAEALDMVRLGHLEHRRPTELSGGQQQRVAVARALVNHPTVLLLDEPLGALDLKLRKDMQLELKELQQQVGITFVYVTHDQEEALTMSDRIAVMHDGHILQEGAPREIYERPATRFVADFIGLTNFLDGQVIELRSDRVLVKVSDGLVVSCEVSGGPAVGSAVTVAVRPEKIELADQPPTASANSWRGQVMTGTFLGEQTEYAIRLEQGPLIVVRRQNVGVNGSAPNAAPGSFVYVSWAPDVSLVLPGPTDHRV